MKRLLLSLAPITLWSIGSVFFIALSSGSDSGSGYAAMLKEGIAAGIIGILLILMGGRIHWLARLIVIVLNAYVIHFNFIELTAHQAYMVKRTAENNVLEVTQNFLSGVQDFRLDTLGDHMVRGSFGAADVEQVFRPLLGGYPIKLNQIRIMKRDFTAISFPEGNTATVHVRLGIISTQWLPSSTQVEGDLIFRLKKLQDQWKIDSIDHHDSA